MLAVQKHRRDRVQVLHVEQRVGVEQDEIGLLTFLNEYELPSIGQTQVNPKIDLTYARTLNCWPGRGWTGIGR